MNLSVPISISIPIPKPRLTSLSTFLAFAIMFAITSVTNIAGAQDVYPVSGDAIAEQSDSDDKEIARLQRGLHGMTMIFIRFAQEQEVDAYEAGQWTGTFLSRYADETFDPQEFMAWMKDELSMHEVTFEVLEDAPDRIEARRGQLLTREKLPWFYRYGITLDEYEEFYHGALTEIAKAYGVSYSQTREGEAVRLTIREGEGQSD